jgi:hypothetical protein
MIDASRASPMPIAHNVMPNQQTSDMHEKEIAG